MVHHVGGHGHHHTHHHHHHHGRQVGGNQDLGGGLLSGVHGGRGVMSLAGPSSKHHRVAADDKKSSKSATDMVAASYGVVHIKQEAHPKHCSLFTTTGKKIPCKLATEGTRGFQENIPQQLDINGVAYPARLDEFGVTTMFATSSCCVS